MKIISHEQVRMEDLPAWKRHQINCTWFVFFHIRNELQEEVQFSQDAWNESW